MEDLMGRSWSINDLAWKSSMAYITTIAESPLDENKLYVGSGDGLIHYTNDGGINWNKASSISGLPKYARIHQIVADYKDANVAYAACHDFVGGSKKPFLYKTKDGGKTWTSLNGNLPDVGATYTVAVDHVDPNLLFVGTQFGLYVSNDGGKDWIAFKNGMPNTTVMDIEIQRRENDLVVSTFGRSIYILDDYTPLRSFSKDIMAQDAYIFPIKDGLMFIEDNKLGRGDVGNQGASLYNAPNPELGVVFTYYVKDEYKSLKEQRRELEKKQQEKGEKVKFPDYETLEKENTEVADYLLFTIADDDGNVVRKIKKDVAKGLQRVVWDFRYTPNYPINFESVDPDLYWVEDPEGYMALPGNYTVSLTKYSAGAYTELVAPQAFLCKSLNNTTLPAEDKKALDEFNKKVAELTRALSGADEYRGLLNDRIAYLKKAVYEAPNVPNTVSLQIEEIESDMRAIGKILHGDYTKSYYEGASPTALRDRIDLITYSLWATTAAPTTTYIKSYDYAAARYDEMLASILDVETKMNAVEEELEKYGAQATPGRIPVWQKDN
jgi:hypothetical protein